MNLQSYIVLAVVAVALIFVIVRLVKNRGKHSCGGNCSACSGCCYSASRTKQI